MLIIKFDSIFQMNIFFSLINNSKGLTRDSIHEKTNIAKTTIIDNIKKLKNRHINSIPYVKQYRNYNYQVGRPKTLFYIPKIIRNKFLSIDIPKIQLYGIPIENINKEINKNKF